MNDHELSDNYKQLDSTGQKRYEEKLSMLGLKEDPYVLPGSTDRSLWPQVEYPDIYNYLINSPSPYTKESLKAYKSSEAWSYFIAGFISDIHVVKVSKALVIKAKVSQCICTWYLLVK